VSTAAFGEPQVDRPAVPWTKQFRRKLPTRVVPPDQLRRQDSVLRCAWQNLNEAGPVIAFLNTHNQGLGGQPLQVALHSDDGLVRVERVLSEIGTGAVAAAPAAFGGTCGEAE
jgi:hypothetical protein